MTMCNHLHADDKIYVFYIVAVFVSSVIYAVKLFTDKICYFEQFGHVVKLKRHERMHLWNRGLVFEVIGYGIAGTCSVAKFNSYQIL